jgi:hypothetical protein
MRVSKNMRNSLKKPSQKKVAMSMLPLNRITVVGVVPYVEPYSKFARGHRTIQGLLRQYPDIRKKKQILNGIRAMMKK